MAFYILMAFYMYYWHCEILPKIFDSLLTHDDIISFSPGSDIFLIKTHSMSRPQARNFDG